MLKKFGVKGKDEAEDVAYALRLFQSVAFPLGMVRVGDTGDLTEHDANVSEYDYTIYTAVMCAESGRFYWMTYTNPIIKSIGFDELGEEKATKQFESYWKNLPKRYKRKNEEEAFRPPLCFYAYRDSIVIGTVTIIWVLF